MNHLADSAVQRSVVALVTAFCFLASAVAAVLGQSDVAALPTADFVVAMPPGQLVGEFPIRTERAGRVTVLMRGLSGGGEVRAERNGQAVDRVELLATGGLKQGRADAALVTLELPAGESRVRVAESPGVQMVRAAGTNLWFGTHSEAGGKPLFSVDLDQLQKNDVEYPVVAYYGGEGRPFCWFSGKWASATNPAECEFPRLPASSNAASACSTSAVRRGNRPRSPRDRFRFVPAGSRSSTAARP